jgi:hypothetical protein
MLMRGSWSSRSCLPTGGTDLEESGVPESLSEADVCRDRARFCRDRARFCRDRARFNSVARQSAACPRVSIERVRLAPRPVRNVAFQIVSVPGKWNQL